MSVRVDKVSRHCPGCNKPDMQLTITYGGSGIYKCNHCGEKTYSPPPPRRPDPNITPTTMKGNYPNKDAPLGPPSPGRNPGTGFAPPKRERGTDHTKGIKFWSILIYIIASTMLHSAMLLLSPTLTTLAIIGVLWFWGWVCLHEYWSSEIPKKKHATEQMATLEDLFDGYEDDVPIGRLYFEQDIPNIDPDWNGEYIRWGLTAYTRKPGREDVFLQDLMLSDFEPCDDDEKPKRGHIVDVTGDDDPVGIIRFPKPPRPLEPPGYTTFTK